MFVLISPKLLTCNLNTMHFYYRKLHLLKCSWQKTVHFESWIWHKRLILPINFRTIKSYSIIPRLYSVISILDKWLYLLIQKTSRPFLPWAYLNKLFGSKRFISLKECEFKFSPSLRDDVYLSYLSFLLLLQLWVNIYWTISMWQALF